MPFQGFSFDDSVTRTEAGRARVPEGYYLIECEGMEPTAADYDKTAGIWNKIRIVQGPDAAPGLGVGGRLRDYNAVGKADAQFGLGQTLGAFGYADVAKALAGRAIPTYQHFEALAKALSARCAGKRAVALIADQPGQTRPFSGVEALYPESDWATYRQAQVLGQGMAPQAQARANGPAAAAPSAADVDIFSDLDAAI
jgi:hypothetical protein